MEQSKNPVHTKGYRNVFCPYYRNCLDHAIQNHWEYWACLDCQHKRKEKLVTDTLLLPVNDDPYYSLPQSLYKKDGTYKINPLF